MKNITSLLLLLFFSLGAFGQDDVSLDRTKEQKMEMVNIYFDNNSSDVDAKLNSANLDSLSNLMQELISDSLTVITKVKINSYASPEGGKAYNEKLSKKRSKSMYNYFIENFAVDKSLIDVKYSGIDWHGLEVLVDSSDMQYEDEIIDIIHNVPEETWARVNPNDRWKTLVDSRNKHLMDLHRGNPYRDMYAKLFPLMRRGSIITIYYRTYPPIVFADKSNIGVNDTAENDSTTTQEPVDEPAPALEDEQLIVPEFDVKDDSKSLKFALKTNLLYDVALMPNIELEIPIGKRWSVAGEWMFPWWVTKNDGYALEMLAGQVEGRYWFGNRENKPLLTGWYAGIYAGGGLYDLQWKNNGYQGEFYVAAGISGGYAHTINKKGNLRMEYSLGLGYLSTDYRYYEGKHDNEFLVWQHDGNFSWFGPTKAEVSLVWFIDWKF